MLSLIREPVLTVVFSLLCVLGLLLRHSNVSVADAAPPFNGRCDNYLLIYLPAHATHA